MKFICCGLVYSTQDPETYQFIETYLMKTPTLHIIAGIKIEKEIVYTLCCKKNGCLKLEIHRYYKEDNDLKLLMTRALKGSKAIKFLEETKDIRIKLTQSNPAKNVFVSKNIPWVYGKSISEEKQVARYFDESGNRNVFQNGGWKKEVFKSEMNKHTI